MDVEKKVDVMKYDLIKVATGEQCLIERDEKTGAISVLKGPPDLEELVEKALARGVWKNHSVRDGEAWLTSIRRVDPKDPSYGYVLRGILEIFGFKIKEPP